MNHRQTHITERKRRDTASKYWISGDFEKTSKFEKHNYTCYDRMSSIQLFELMISENVLELLETETSRYAINSGYSDSKITKDKLKCFIGILLISGYNRLPGKDFYWDSDLFMGNNDINQSMRRDRFRKIMRFLHCVGNNKKDQNNKMWKLQPLCDLLYQNILGHFVPIENINYDKSMVKYLAIRFGA